MTEQKKTKANNIRPQTGLTKVAVEKESRLSCEVKNMW